MPMCMPGPMLSRRVETLALGPVAPFDAVRFTPPLHMGLRAERALQPCARPHAITFAMPMQS
jgi:hypothetical protein